MSQILRELAETEEVKTEPHLRLADDLPPGLGEPPKLNQKQTLRVFALLVVVSFASAGLFHSRKSDPRPETRSNSTVDREYIAARNHEAVTEFYRGQSERALANIQAGIDKDSHDAALWTNRGILLRHLNRAPEAITAFERAIEITPASAQALNGLGRVQLDLGNLSDAERFLKKAQTVNPALPETLLNLGELSEKRQQWETSANYYQQYLQNPEADSALKKMIYHRNQNINAFVSINKKVEE